MYKDLSLKEKSELFKLMVSNGITDINEIEKIYNSYSDGGYLSYMEKLAKKKAKDWGMEEDEALTMMLNDNEYDYKAFYNNNREEALKMLNSDSNAHFSDIGKTVWHPTFSDQSIYSGKVSEYNPKGTIGGSWLENQYIPSDSQITNGDFNYRKTADYLYKSPGREFIDARYNPDYLGKRPNYLELETFYPFTSRYPYTGHSALLGAEFSIDENGEASYIHRVSKNMGDKGYNIVTNNCSDATKCALENAFNKELDTFLFTTPGDVQDWAVEELGGIPKIKEDSVFNPEKGKYVLDTRSDKTEERESGKSTVYIPITPEQRRRYIDYVKKGKEEGIFKYGGKVNKFGGDKVDVNNLPESEQYAVTTPDGQRKVFNNKEEAQAYITDNTPKGYSLYDTTNYASNIDKGQTAILNRNTEREIEKATEEEIRTNARKANIESNKEYAMEALNAMPIIGDGMDIYSIIKDTYNKNYGNAAITAGMMLVPFDKLLKPVGKGIKKLFTKAKKKSTDNGFYQDHIFSNLKPLEPLEQTFLKPKEKIYIPDQLSLEESLKINDFWNDIFLNKYDTNRLKIHNSLKRESLPGEFISIKSTDPMALEGALGHSHRKDAYIYSDINIADKGEVVLHEGTHNFRDTTPQTPDETFANYNLDPNERQYVDPSKFTTEEIDALDNAYTFTEDYDYNNLGKSYRARLAEKGATNTQLQYALYKKYNIKNNPELYKIIDNLTDDDLIYELQQTNGYGKNFVKQLRTLPKKEQNVKIANIRNALKYVPATIGVGAGLSLINNTEDNQYKYGGAINKFSGVSNEVKQKKEIIYPDIVYKHRELWNKEMERRKSRMKDARKKQQKRKSYAEEAHRIMDVLNSSAEKDLQLKNNLQEGIEGAINEQQEQQRENYYNNQLFLNSLATAAELGSAAWMLGKGAKALGILPNRLASSGLYSSDTPQIVSGIAGTLADSYQLATATTPKDIIENSVELPFDVAGIIGGTNVVRNTPFFGRYRNVIDNILDGAGYIAAGYDGIIKPIDWTLSQFNNAATPEEFPIVLPEITVVGNKKSRGGLINKYDGTSTKTQQMQTMEKPAFFEGDTWKPQYWFSPEYEANTLKGAITQAYEDGNYGKDIIWNGRAYKAILNEEDSKEYRKEKGITLGEPIVNTANIKTNEKQPREYVSNSYIPITSGNKTYYWDSYSGKFFKDAKGKVPTSEDYNTLLKDYYDQNISPALKENRYEDLIKLYVQQFRNLQARRRVSAREQDIPNDYGKRTIPITTGRSGSSRLPYPTDLIDSLSNHLQEGQSIYQALALPYKETEFGNRVNFESDVMGNRGHVLATLNDERYELPDQTFYSGFSYPLRAYFRNNKVNGKVDGMTQENFVKHYLASSENDLLDLKNLFNNKELLKYVGETLKKDLTKSRFVSFMNTNTKDNPNIYEHALSLLASGKYNPGEPGYNKGINKIAKQLENDPELNSYIDKHKIKKVGEKKK